jgi:hypothetical protein
MLLPDRNELIALDTGILLHEALDNVMVQPEMERGRSASEHSALRERDFQSIGSTDPMWVFESSCIA